MNSQNEFTNIINIADNIVSGFAQENNDNDIEKAIEFEKTEKDIFIKIVEKIKKLEDNLVNIQNLKSFLLQSIGEEPKYKSKYYNNYDNTKIEENITEYLTFNNNGLQCSENEAVEDSINDSKEKERYNNLCRRYFYIKDSIKELNKTKENLSESSKRKMKLSIYELEQFGF